jgi:GGDEF domain-containing protein
MGGDEFGLLLPGANPRYAAGIAIRLCDLLASRPLVVRNHPAISERITLSIGVAAWREGDGMHAPMRRFTTRRADVNLKFGPIFHFRPK